MPHGGQTRASAPWRRAAPRASSPRPSWRRSPAWATLWLVIAAGCGGSAASSGPAAANAMPGPTAPATAALPPPADLAAAPVGRVFSARFGLSVPLPDAANWRLDHGRSSFLVLDHAATSSRLVVRTWRETENMNHQRCEQRARARRDLPVRHEDGALSQQTLDVPPEFDTVVDVGFAAQAPGEPVSGYVMAFGGWVRQCFAYIYTTSATGPGAERVVGDRLAVMDARSLGGIEVRSDTAPQVGPGAETSGNR